MNRIECRLPYLQIKNFKLFHIPAIKSSHLVLLNDRVWDSSTGIFSNQCELGKEHIFQNILSRIRNCSSKICFYLHVDADHADLQLRVQTKTKYRRIPFHIYVRPKTFGLFGACVPVADCWLLQRPLNTNHLTYSLSHSLPYENSKLN